MLFGLRDAATPTGIPGVDQLIDYIKGQAQAGAEGAIPEIQQQVRATVTPYIIGLGLVASVALLFSLAAFERVNKLNGGS